MSAKSRQAEEEDEPLSTADLRVAAREVIANLVQEHNQRLYLAGEGLPSNEEDEALVNAVHAAMYGVGRLQPWLENLDVENIDINGCDRVFIGWANGKREKVAPIADSDAELIEDVRTLAAFSGLSSRPLDDLNCELDLKLPDGSRLSAVISVSNRPAISIRRARLSRVSLAELEANGTLTPQLARFLGAAVRAQKNIMIAGAVNAGKTTLLRAMANEIPPKERLVTVERVLELGLHEFEDLHPDVVALEERRPNSEGVGRVSMADLVRRSLRMNPSRVIVGEVLGDEIVSMLNAMSQGNDGSLSTIHANSSLDVFEKISTYAIQAAERLSAEASQRLIAGAIEFVVFIKRVRDPLTGDMQRRVLSVREVNGNDGGVLSSEIFEFRGGRLQEGAVISDRRLEELMEHGYEPNGAFAGWTA
ncbi:CpaF family protein [Kitasatospora sp. NPDC088548]|uniref:CpaF family protein n=1 Tax=Kitasatospora sp. NPDC088548 TaxID=3364075 RepID=UPI003821DB58